MLDTYEKNSKAKLVTIIVTVLVVAGVILIIDHLRGQGTAALTQSSLETTSSQTENSNANSSTSDNTYRDGSYSVDISYFVPSGQEDIKVDLTLASDTVTAVSIQNSENDHDSAGFQGDFAAGYKQYVVGKKIAGLKVKVVAGASDTAQAFNDAMSQIASRARA
jgi:hypothetical protein